MGACMNSKEGESIAARSGCRLLEKKTNHQGISGNITGNRVNSIYGIDRGAIYQPAEYLRYGRACDGVQPGNDEE